MNMPKISYTPLVQEKKKVEKRLTRRERRSKPKNRSKR